MRRFLKFLLLSSACLCVSQLAYAQELPRARVSILPGIDSAPAPQFAQLMGTCSMEVAPTKAAIVGGVAVGALKPTEAAAQLDKQLEVIRKYVEEQHGQLQLLERARTVKNPPARGPEANDPPFQVVQRLEADFAADAPLDAILDRLIELGLDRFGENILNGNSSRRESVLRFRVPGWDVKMRNFQDICAADAWNKWCATAAAKGVCQSDLPPAELQAQYFSVRSAETVLHPDGGTRRWEFNFAPNQRVSDPPDLLGVITLHLNGSITLNYTYIREEKP